MMTDLSTGNSTVKLGDHVIIQRKSYLKLHKITSKGIVQLGNDKIQLSDIIGKPLWTTYKLEPVPKSRREFKLIECTDMDDVPEDFITDSGADNRDIYDDGTSQKLSTANINELRDSGCSHQEILGQLVENSTSFMNKTEYSQEKYLKKKEKKYFDYITIRQPTIRLVFDILYKLDPTKLLGLRLDTLSLLTTAVDMHSDRTFILYESGCQGVVTASMMNCISDGGNLIHIHPGLTPQKQAVAAMNLSEQQLDRLLSVNIHSLLGMLHPDAVQESSLEIKTDVKSELLLKSDLVSAVEDKETMMIGNKRSLEEERSEERPPKRARWEIVTERAAEMLRQRKADGLVMVAKEHPTNILKALLPWVGVSMPFVVFSLYREPLQDLYVHLKSTSSVTALRLNETWLRTHQVLPNRTHPDVLMSGGGGFILTGITVDG